MSDLIERLREMAGPSLGEGDSDTVKEAATEIERLRGAIGAADHILTYAPDKVDDAAYTLRAALEQKP